MPAQFSNPIYTIGQNYAYLVLGKRDAETAVGQLVYEGTITSKERLQKPGNGIRCVAGVSECIVSSLFEDESGSECDGSREKS
jgi:hypothetical protein